MIKPVWFLLVFLLLPPLWVQGQEDPDYKVADRRARRAPESLWHDLPALTAYLCPPDAGDFERARAIYAWITLNIDYDMEAYRDDRKRINRNIGDILRRRQAVCFGYAQLFQSMAGHAGLTAEVISGYSKGTLTAAMDREAPDHAWNAVLLAGQWFLLDATWGSSTLKKEDPFLMLESDQYFLTPSDSFILNHLPAQPMWQLLSSPVTPELFQQPADSIRQYLRHASSHYNFVDSIAAWQRLPAPGRSLWATREAFRFLPSPKNRRELAQSLMDFASTLVDSAEAVQSDRLLDSLIRLQDRIIRICEEALFLAGDLYPWQTELFIGTLINQGVAEVRNVFDEEDKPTVVAAYRRAREYLVKASDLLASLPPDSLYAAVARRRCEDYLEVIGSYLKE